MALTTAITGLTPQQWDADFFEKYVRANQFAKYFGTSENSMIQVKEDLSKKPGDSVTFALVDDLVGAGRVGTEVLEGQEEALGSRSYKLSVSLLRNGVVVHEWDEQKSAIDLRNAAKSQLKRWAMKKLRTDIITALNSINGIPYQTGAGDGTTGTSEAQKDAWLVDNYAAGRCYFGAAVANYQAGDHSAMLAQLDDSADKFTYTNLSLARRVLRAAANPVRPIQIEDGTEWYVAFAPSNAFRDLKISLATLNSTAEVRGKDNPLYKDGDLLWDGIIVKEIPEMGVEASVGGSSTSVGRVKICGAQALGIAWAQRTTSRTEVRDYGGLHGVAIQEIRGVGKLLFGSGSGDQTDLIDNGVFTYYCAAPANA